MIIPNTDPSITWSVEVHNKIFRFSAVERLDFDLDISHLLIQELALSPRKEPT